MLGIDSIHAAWMIRAGRSGKLFNEFFTGHIGVGWLNNVDLTNINTYEEILQLFAENSPSRKFRKISIQAMMLYKFRSVLSIGDKVMTYDTKNREYLLGTVTSNYCYEDGMYQNYSHVRKIEWKLRFNRDALSINSKNSLRSGLTLFLIKKNVLAEILLIYFGKKTLSLTG